MAAAKALPPNHSSHSVSRQQQTLRRRRSGTQGRQHASPLAVRVRGRGGGSYSVLRSTLKLCPRSVVSLRPAEEEEAACAWLFRSASRDGASDADASPGGMSISTVWNMLGTASLVLPNCGNRRGKACRGRGLG